MMRLETQGDRYVVVTRRFAATAKALYRAHTEPETHDISRGKR